MTVLRAISISLDDSVWTGTYTTIYCPLLKRTAVNLLIVGTILYNTRRRMGGNKTDPIKNTSLCYCMPFFSLVAICQAFRLQQT